LLNHIVYELSVIECSVLVDLHLFHELLHLLDSHLISYRHQDFLQVLELHGAFAGVVIEHLKGLDDLISEVLLVLFARDDEEELIEVKLELVRVAGFGEDVRKFFLGGAVA
jgi:hypothetical protein